MLMFSLVLVNTSCVIWVGLTNKCLQERPPSHDHAAGQQKDTDLRQGSSPDDLELPAVCLTSQLAQQWQGNIAPGVDAWVRAAAGHSPEID